MKNDAIIGVIKDGLEAITKEQLANGGFATLSSSDPKNFSESHQYMTVFATANILNCLNAIETSCGSQDIGTWYAKLRNIQYKAVSFLLAQKSEYWSFNYWN